MPERTARLPYISRGICPATKKEMGSTGTLISRRSTSRHHCKMKAQQLTVMGPEGSASPPLALSPASFNEGTDRLVWIESVNNLGDNILACATGGENKEKGITACIGLTIYKSLTRAKEQD